MLADDYVGEEAQSHNVAVEEYLRTEYECQV